MLRAHNFGSLQFRASNFGPSLHCFFPLPEVPCYEPYRMKLHSAWVRISQPLMRIVRQVFVRKKLRKVATLLMWQVFEPSCVIKILQLHAGCSNCGARASVRGTRTQACPPLLRLPTRQQLDRVVWGRACPDRCYHASDHEKHPRHLRQAVSVLMCLRSSRR